MGGLHTFRQAADRCWIVAFLPSHFELSVIRDAAYSEARIGNDWRDKSSTETEKVKELPFAMAAFMLLHIAVIP